MKKNKALFLASFLLFLSIVSIASADTGPHQAVDLYFHVTYNSSNITGNFSANLLACRTAECEYDNGELCTDGVCRFMYYRVERVPRVMKLLVNLDQGNFTSDMINFSWRDPEFYYDIDIDPNNRFTATPTDPFDVEEDGNPDSVYYLISFVIALVLTIAIEIVILVIFLKKWRIRSERWKRLIVTVIIADIISVPLVWIIFFCLLVLLAATLQWLALYLAILVAEAFAVVFEGYFVYWLNKKAMTLKRSFIISIVMNIASFAVGGFILTLLLGLFL